MKASEIFEGENSSLRKTFDEAVANPERTVEEMEDTDDFITDEITTCMEGYRTSVDGIEATYYIDRLTEVINQTLQDERQRRDEMVEAERAKVMTIIEQRISDTKKYFSEKAPHNCSLCWEEDYCSHEIEREALEDLKKALTQTNNHK